MKLPIFCLFAVLACSAANDTVQRKRKLHEVLKEVRNLKADMQHSGPSKASSLNIEHDCCCLEALRCFQRSVLQLNVSKKEVQYKLRKSLNNPLTVQSFSFCDVNSVTQTKCRSCDSFPRGAQESLDQLESLIEKVITRQSETN